ncbi:NADH:flavin oxidoreductase/NADH oxidase [Croceicoccus mobilis]|uniref:NADH:flavin oxidoreductase/NADH oxidase n=1 Tax=Croceicoccus mobilis TaxID=1703339 RepID=A0A916YS32_9SPHN|nr:NADH:flavin oxidoreductase/NADH oxidase [Croceicoccus mobilis]GGD58252.1 NADH:flavin oxidoreductase/NADH oxidase [Croceicoccus mobilis]
MTELFSPFTLKDVTLRNRIAVPPMCQYSARDGYVTEWHQPHYTSLARGGAGLVIVEATAVSPEGRISPEDLGIWEDGQIEGLSKIAHAIKAGGAAAGIQIAHAGRKASARRPWDGDDHIMDAADGGWETISPSAIPFGANLPKEPKEMTLEDIERVKADFVAGAKRAREAGFDWLELHFAHGYLAQSFFSIHANTRTDEYGGDAEGRGRFLLETVQAVREVWPENLPLTARFGVLEFDGRDEETMAEAAELVRKFKHAGLDFLNVSIGFSTTESNIPWGDAFMAPIARKMREETGLPVATAWGMDKPADAAAAIDNGDMDLVMIGHAHLANPHYPVRVARDLGLDVGASLLPAPYGSWLAKWRDMRG